VCSSDLVAAAARFAAAFAGSFRSNAALARERPRLAFARTSTRLRSASMIACALPAACRNAIMAVFGLEDGAGGVFMRVRL
jgi:hypothetical protein